MKTKNGLSFLFVIFLFLCSVTFLADSGHAAADKPEKERVLKAYAKLPLYFVENKGQIDPKVRFYVKTSGQTLYFTDEGIVFDLVRGQRNAEKDTEDPAKGRQTTEAKTERLVFNLRFENAQKGVLLEGFDAQNAGVNYFVGNDRNKWKTNISTYKGIVCKGVYNGIDLKIFGNGKDIEYEFIVNPGANPQDILLSYNGIEGLAIDDVGDLLIATPFGELKEKRPYIYQEIEGRKTVDGSFEIQPHAAQSQTRRFSYSFQIASYDSRYPLIIDPTLSYSTYLGGSGYDWGNGITVDGSGSTYVTGYTYSSDFPTESPCQGTFGGNYDAFITKLSPSGNALIYSTYLGGSKGDLGNAIGVDGSGSVYVTGSTYSIDFPTENPDQGTFGGYYDAFIAKLSPSGTALIYSTYLGGTSADEGHGIAVDGSGNAYVTGETFSSDFPTENPYQGSHAGGGNDAFITKLSATGSIVYSTYLGGLSIDEGHGIAVDGSGNAYVTGATFSDFPMQNPYQGTKTDSLEVFITKLSPSGNALIYSTYLGGSWDECGLGITVDGSGSAYVTGYTYSIDFPTENPYQRTLGGNYDAFITKLSPSGSALIYSTYLGGDSEDRGCGTAVDSSGNAHVTGYTKSTDFPIQDPYQGTYGGGNYDAFVAKLSTFPTVTTQAVTGIGTTTATGNGTIKNLGSPNPTQHGVCWNTTGTPTIADSRTEEGPASATGPFTSSMTGLSANSTYYVRAYATNSGGTSYGNEVNFTSASDPPTAATNAATSVTSSGATLNGTVNPNGGSTTVTFEYGTNTDYGNSIPASQSPISGITAQSVSASISGLSPGTTYHFRVKAVNSEGTAYGDDVTFTTSVTAPSATTSAANPVGPNSATLNGTVNPNGASTTVTFEYGTTTSYGSTVTASQSPLAGTSSQTVTAGITGLDANTTYHFRVKASNTAGTSYGSDQSFATASAAPTVVTGSAGSITTDGATLNGTVNPNGLSTTYYFQYGKTTNYGLFTGPVSAGAGSSQLSVSAYVTELSSSTTYHYRLIAYNGLDTTYGEDKTFTTDAPPATAPTVTTGWATSVTGSSAKLNGTINPNGAATTYYFQYGTTTGYGSTTASASTEAGTSDVSVNATIAELPANTTYHFRLVGSNSAGAAYGSDQSFTTGATPKAIIVAGGGPYAENHIWDATEMIAAFAFKALLYQGYTKETVFFLSSNTSYDVDGDGNSDVDAAATLSNLENAITVWAKDASDLFLFMVDHGGVGKFGLSPTQELLAQDLDDWLDSVQNNGVEKVVVLYDACHSGSFVPLLIPPAGKQRILATSVASTENSLFLKQGKNSFSFQFWASIFNGDSFYTAFLDSEQSVFGVLTNRMHPQIEANGNGTGNEKEDKTLASQVEIGLGIQSASGLPRIGSVSSPQTVYLGASALVFAKDVVALAGVNRVWAVITPPDYAGSDNPVTDLPICNMELKGGQYEGTYSDFNAEGTYNIAVFVEDSKGFLSLPVQTVVNATSAAATTTTTTTTSTTTPTTTTSTTTTTLPKPAVLTGAVSGPGTDSATLRGTVNPNGITTSYYFQYGRSGGYGAATTSTSIGAGTSEIAVTESISGLQPGAEYHYRLVGTSNGGTSYGSDQSFKTAYASIVFVHPTDTTCGGNSPCCKTIQQAIDTAETGYEIRIAGGAYPDSYELNASKLLTLSGRWNDRFTEQTGAATVIKAPKAPQGSLTLQNVNIVP